MIGSDNECYVSENKGFADFDLAINSPNTQPPRDGENSDLSASQRICAALASSQIVRPQFCDSCFVEGLLFGHYDDCSQPSSVQWLCRKCHIARHRMLAVEHGRQLRLAVASSGSPNTVERRGREC